MPARSASCAKISAVRGEKNSAKSTSPRGQRPHGFGAEPGRRARLVEHRAINGKAVRAQQAGQIAGDGAARDMEEPPLAGAQPGARQGGQIGERPAGALDPGKSFIARPRRARLADREERHGALAGEPRQRAHPVGAGAQNGLHPGEIGGRPAAVMDLEQRLDDRRDAARGECLGEALRLGARPGHQGAQAVARRVDGRFAQAVPMDLHRARSTG